MKENYHKISCAVLAGGKSTRFDGKNKALIEVGCKNNLEKLIILSDRLFSEMLIISNSHEPYKKYRNIRVIPDIISDIGPLGGIHAALTASACEAVFFFPCDMPFINYELVKDEVDEFFKKPCDILVPRTGGLIEPLHSIYSKNILPELDRHIRTTENYSIRNFFTKVNVRYWDLESDETTAMAFFNINTHHDLTEAQKRNRKE